MKKIDTVYLEDIIDSIAKIEKFVADFTFSDFEQDDKTQFAVFHALEVIGEAANQLSKNTANDYSRLPLREAVEMRNFLVHAYDQIDLAIVWKTIQESLPEFKSNLQAILNQFDN